MIRPQAFRTQTKFGANAALATARRGSKRRAMAKLASIAALIAGLWLVYTGYERQHSLAGRADGALSTLGQKIDGADHAPAHVRYYVAGAVLVVGGLMGLGFVKR